MKSAVTDGADARDVRRDDEGLGPDERGGHEHVEADARPDGREGAALSDTIYALSSGAPPAGGRGRPDQRAAGRRGARGAGRGGCPSRGVATLRARCASMAKSLDNALIIRFPGPASATGEDIAELHLHGGRAVVARGARARSARWTGCARPRRASSPAAPSRMAASTSPRPRGLADLLEAETEAQRRAALALAGGALSRAGRRPGRSGCWRWPRRSRRRSISPTRTMSRRCPPISRARSPRCAAEMAAWLARPPAERLKDGVRVVIAGPPNAGKSSLLNALAGREAAIVTAIAGHDARSDRGAGRDRRHALPADRHGRAARDRRTRSRRSASTAPGPRLDGGRYHPLARRRRRRRRRARSCVHAKADLGPPPAAADLAVSALTGAGLDELVRPAAWRVPRSLLPGEGEVALNARHRAALARGGGGAGGGRDGCATC